MSSGWLTALLPSKLSPALGAVESLNPSRTAKELDVLKYQPSDERPIIPQVGVPGGPDHMPRIAGGGSIVGAVGEAAEAKRRGSA